MARVTVRVALSLLPLAFTPVLGKLLAQGSINLGGGEKDIVVMIPWMLWSILFAAGSWIFWRRGYMLGASLWRSALFGLAGVVIVAIALVVLGQLGVWRLF